MIDCGFLKYTLFTLGATSAVQVYVNKCRSNGCQQYPRHQFSFVCPFVAEKVAIKCHIWMDGWMDVAPWYYKWMDWMGSQDGVS